jgi:hypothetical protein
MKIKGSYMPTKVMFALFERDCIPKAFLEIFPNYLNSCMIYLEPNILPSTIFFLLDLNKWRHNHEDRRLETKKYYLYKAYA